MVGTLVPELWLKAKNTFFCLLTLCIDNFVQNILVSYLFTRRSWLDYIGAFQGVIKTPHKDAILP